LVKKLREETLAENYSDGMYDESRSEADSSTTNDSYYEVRNRWRSAEDVRKVSELERIGDRGSRRSGSPPKNQPGVID